MDDTIAVLGKPVTSRMIGFSGKPAAALARWRHGPTVFDLPPSNAIRLAVSLVDGRNARAGASRTLAVDRHGGSVSLFAPQEGLSLDVRGEADVIQLLIDRDAVQPVLREPSPCPPVIDLHDDAVRLMIMRLFVGHGRRGPDDELMEEESLLDLLTRLERHMMGRRGARETPLATFRGGLAPATFRRLEAMIETAVDEASALTLDEMARAIDLSLSHFVRAFRRHTGYTPHRYILRRRMNRAISLLRLRAIPVADVADELGFSTAAHFVATFRSIVGVTPGALRDALGSQDDVARAEVGVQAMHSRA